MNKNNIFTHSYGIFLSQGPRKTKQTAGNQNSIEPNVYAFMTEKKDPLEDSL